MVENKRIKEAAQKGVLYKMEMICALKKGYKIKLDCFRLSDTGSCACP